MYDLVSRKKNIFIANINVLLFNLFGYAKEKGSITTKAANKTEPVTIKKVVDKNDSILKVVKLIKKKQNYKWWNKFIVQNH